uniref:Uncharacterized protein n=1 Tax=Wuchereria bancrofti TaxID=6293 RepID=A0A1I8ERX5_WUCBA
VHVFQSGSVEIIAQPENSKAQKLKVDEFSIPVKMSPVAVIHTAFPKKDADESPRVKVVESKSSKNIVNKEDMVVFAELRADAAAAACNVENKGSSKINKENRSIASELNTLKDVPQSMPIVDVQHDKTKNDKFFASAELL